MNKKAKILVVDDEENIRDSLNEILIDEGYEVLLAEDANVARKIKNDKNIDLILLDIWMPDCDGITLLKEWVKNHQLNCPVIMMSGHGTIDTAIEATKIGAFDFLEKPISLQKLLKTVGAGLKRIVDVKRLTPEFIEKSQHNIVRDLKQRIKNLKKEDLFFILGANNNFFKIIISYLYGNDVYLLDSKKKINESLLNIIQDKGKNFLVISDNESLREISSLEIKKILDNFSSKGIRIVISDSDENFVKKTFFNNDQEFSNYLYLPVGKDVDSIPEYANALLDYYISINPNLGYKELDISALNFMRSSGAFLDFDYLDNCIYKIVNSVQKEQISRDDLEGFNKKNDDFLTDESNNIDYDRPLKEARNDFEKNYFVYHLNKNKSIVELSKIADIERTHLYRKLKQLGIKSK